MRYLLIVLLVVGVASCALGLEKRALEMREDFGTEPLYDCYMNYYYYIPCPTNSWFWAFSGWDRGQVVGAWFRVGDPCMGRAGSGCPPYVVCEPCGAENKSIERLRVLDFAGYGATYPGLFTVRFDLYCCDDQGRPIGGRLYWSSGPIELTTAGWNYIDAYYGDFANCSTEGGWCYPQVLVTATHIGTEATYPAWGFDNISQPVSLGCAMHDDGCCPALYPRPQASHYSTMHSGDYGVGFVNFPPDWFLDPADSVGDVYGYVELAWRIYTWFHVGTEGTTWGAVKSMYR